MRFEISVLLFLPFPDSNWPSDYLLSNGLIFLLKSKIPVGIKAGRSNKVSYSSSLTFFG
jgi:hypothetical protein